MNWTGGRLQRSKHAGTALSAKQKAHFAKARMHLQRSHERRSPVRFSITEDVGYVGDDATLGWGVDPKKDWEPRETSIEAGSYVVSAKAPTDVSPSINLSSPQSVAFLKSCGGPTKRSPSTSSQPWVRPKNKRRTVSNSKPVGVEDLRAKRLELLQRNDWFESSVTRPLKMDFLPTKNIPKIGRRRKLTQTDYDRRNQRACVRQHKQRLTSDTDLRSRIRRPGEVDKISIRIGSSIHGTQNATKPLLECLHHINDMLFSSIDVADESSSMLLDVDTSDIVSENGSLLEGTTSEKVLFDQVDPEIRLWSDIKPVSNKSASTDQGISAFSYSSSPAQEDDSTVSADANVENSSITVARTPNRNAAYANPRLVIKSSPPYLPGYTADGTTVAIRDLHQSRSSRIHAHPINNLDSQFDEHQGMGHEVFTSMPGCLADVAQTSAVLNANAKDMEPGCCGNGEDVDRGTRTLETLPPIYAPILKDSTLSRCLTRNTCTSYSKGNDLRPDKIEEDALWWRFVFGEKDEKSNEGTPKGNKIGRNTTATSKEWTEIRSSMEVKASQPTATQQKYDKLNMHQIVFKKPTPFVGPMSAGCTTSSGECLTGSRMRGEHCSASKSATPTKTQPSEMIFTYPNRDE